MQQIERSFLPVLKGVVQQTCFDSPAGLEVAQVEVVPMVVVLEVQELHHLLRQSSWPLLRFSTRQQTVRTPRLGQPWR